MLKNKSLFFLSLLFPFLVEGVPFDSDISFTGGWRCDELKTKVVSYTGKDHPVLKDTAEGKHIDIWEAGLSWHLTSPYEDELDFWSLSGYYLRGNANWGWGNHGNYHEHVTNHLLQKQHYSLHGDIYNARTQDYVIGLGWLYPLDVNFGMGFVGGYSYDKLSYRIKNVDANRNLFLPSLKGAKIESTYQGPWIGMDAAYVWYHWTLFLGYEFHWVTNWKGSHSLKHPDNSFRNSDLQSSETGQGNIAYVDLRWAPCEYFWEAGLALKYSHLDANQGKTKPVKDYQVGTLPIKYGRLNSAKWISYSVTGDIGFRF